MARGLVECTFATTLAYRSNQPFSGGVYAVVHSCRWKFLKHVHNLFTHALWSSSPAGLRLEISCKRDKKKMNLNFNYDQKIFLTGKMQRVSTLKRRHVSKDLMQPKPLPFGITQTNRLRW